MRIMVGLLALGLVLILFVGARASGTTLVVDDDAGTWRDYSTVQDAVNGSLDGDVIRVYDGWYNESVNVTVSVTITGNGTAEGNSSNMYARVFVFNVTAENVTIEMFNLTCDQEYILSTHAGNTTVRENLFNGGGTGFAFADCSHFNVTNNTFDTLYVGVTGEFGEKGYVGGNDFTGITGSSGWGFCLLKDHVNGTIENNRAHTIGVGVKVQDCTDMVIRSNVIVNAGFASMALYSCTGLEVLDNDVNVSTYHGILATSGSDLLFSGNDMVESGFHFNFHISASDDYRLVNNTVNGKDVLYMVGNTSENVTGDYGQAILVECDHINLTGLYLNDTNVGVLVSHSSYITLERINTTDCREGFEIFSSDHVTLIDTSTILVGGTGVQISTGNDFVIERHTSYDGYVDIWASTASNVWIRNSTFNDTDYPIDSVISHVTIEDCSFSDFSYAVRLRSGRNAKIQNISTWEGNYGIYLWDFDDAVVNGSRFRGTSYPITLFDDTNPSYTCDHTNITNCSFVENYQGIYVDGADNCTIRNNTFIESGSWAAYFLWDTAHNEIFWNRFEYCGGTDSQAFDEGVDNQWDNGTIGNYWTDYDGEDADEDGVGDTPYDIDGTSGAQDRYPVYVYIPPATWIVDDDWAGANFSTIQDAVNASHPGDSIRVHAGWYNESVNVDAAIEIEGNGTNATYVKGTGNAFEVTTHGVTLGWMNITGSMTGVFVYHVDRVTVHNCSLDGGWAAVETSASDHFRFVNNTVDSGTYPTRGISINGGSGGVVSGNYIDYLHIGIYVSNQNVTLHNNTVYGAQTAIEMNTADGSVVDSNIIEDGNNGIRVGASEEVIVKWNDIETEREGIGVTGSMYIELYNNTMGGCSVSMGGDSVGHFTTHMLSNNSVNGLGIHYLTNVSSDTVTGVYGELILGGCSELTVSNMSIGNSSHGVVAGFCDNITFDGHHAWQCSYGLDLEHCTDITLADLDLEDNVYGFSSTDTGRVTFERMSSDSDGWTIMTYSSDNITIANSTVTSTSNGLSPGTGSRDFTIINVSFTGSIGMTPSGCNNFTVSDCDFDCTSYAILATYCQDFVIEDCDIEGAGTTGVFLDYSDRMTVRSTNVTDGMYGIGAYRGSEYTFEDNWIHDLTSTGIYTQTIDNSTIVGNYLDHCYYGIVLESESADNLVYMNHLIDSHGTYEAFDNGPRNSWDNGSVGNEWSDYEGPDDDGDGIGDWAYNVSGTAGSQDRYPIVLPLPQLWWPVVAPLTGDIDTVFNFTVEYRHSLGEVAESVHLNLDGHPYEMTAASSGNWTAGWTFYFEAYLDRTSHEYNFSALGGSKWNWTANRTGPEVANRVPVLSSGSRYPMFGNESMDFTFNVTYTDDDNDAPTYVYVEIDGTDYSMSKVDGGDMDYSDGAAYTYVTYLDAGNRSYNFSASDGVNTTGLMGDVFQVNESDVAVKPIAYIDTMDPNPAASTENVTFDGHGSGGTIVEYIWNSSLDGHLSNGSTFQSGPLTSGVHNISFVLRNDDGLWSDPVHEDLLVNTPPMAVNGSVDPSVGYAPGVFHFTVEFVDPDPVHHPSPMVNLWVAGAYRDMTLVANTTNLYEIDYSLSYGRYVYSFYVTDGMESYYSDSMQLRVNRPPVLSDGTVAPEFGNETTLFTFEVNYTDHESDMPTEMVIEIDDTGHNMTEVDPGDNDPSDGKLYSYSVMLAAGNHSYGFNASDGLQTGTLTGGTLQVNESEGPIRPLAFIDSISPDPADREDDVEFQGHGTGGTIVAYIWNSSLDGTLSQSASFSRTSLTVGTHNITLRVKNDDGLWSLSAWRSLEVETDEDLPDLTILGITVLPEDPTSDDEVEISVRATNLGVVNATFDISVYYIDTGSTYTTPDDLTEIDSFSLSIDPDVTEIGTVTWDADEGDYTIVAWGDPSAREDELSETNNVAEEDVSVTEGEDDEDKGGALDPLVAGSLFLVMVLVLIALFFLMRRSPGGEGPVEDLDEEETEEDRFDDDDLSEDEGGPPVGEGDPDIDEDRPREEGEPDLPSEEGGPDSEARYEGDTPDDEVGEGPPGM